MKTYHFKKIILFSLLLGSSQVSWAACTQTLSPGANVASAISSAAAGSTICLNAGSYGTVKLSGINKSSDVVISSTSGRTASLNIQFAGSSHLHFDSLTVTGLDYSGSNKNNTISNNTFTGQAIFNMTNNSNSNTLVDGNTFDGINASSFEGRLHVWDNPHAKVSPGIVISNNHFGGGGCSDGVRADMYGVVIGPGNVFEGITQGSCAAHVDSIQGYGNSNTTITGNYFINDTIYVGFYDGGTNENITHNVFGPPNGSGQQLQLGSIQGGSFIHNTMRNTTAAQGAKAGNPTNKNFSWTNNILVNSSIIDAGDQPGCSPGCTYAYNLGNSTPRGTNAITGSPTFTGGSSPTTFAGYQLTSSSLGYRSASDGNDRGVNNFGLGTPPPSGTPLLAAPQNLRVN